MMYISTQNVPIARQFSTRAHGQKSHEKLVREFPLYFQKKEIQKSISAFGRLVFKTTLQVPNNSSKINATIVLAFSRPGNYYQPSGGISSSSSYSSKLLCSSERSHRRRRFWTATVFSGRLRGSGGMNRPSEDLNWEISLKNYSYGPQQIRSHQGGHVSGFFYLRVIRKWP